MGSRLRIVSFVVGALAAGATSTVMAQPGPLPAADFARQGKDRYNAGDYAGAVEPLSKAVELDPNNFDYKLALAHALARSNQCDRARPIYTELSATADATRKDEVDAGLAACPAAQVTPPPQTPAMPEPPPPAAQVSVSGGGNVGKGPMFMLMGGGALVGAGVILLFAGYTHSGDADAARSVSDHDRIAGRATTEYVLGGIGVAAGIGLSLWAMSKINHSSKHETSISIAPRADGGSLVLGRSW